jgi:hypothetical protein
MLLEKVMKIVSFYKELIKELIKDIKSYYVTICIGSVLIVTAIFIMLAILGGSTIDNFKVIVGSIVSVIGSFILNLYFSNVEKIRSSNKKKKKNKVRAINYYRQRHSKESAILENIEKEYLKVTLDPPTE